jgi:hypothetical protein
LGGTHDWKRSLFKFPRDSGAQTPGLRGGTETLGSWNLKFPEASEFGRGPESSGPSTDGFLSQREECDQVIVAVSITTFGFHGSTNNVDEVRK